MTDYRQQINEQLLRIEQEEQVRIVYACESGSRAWGIASRDSDYDVRFLYVRPVEWYLSIFDKRDVIERPISGMLDINGWDLKKGLNLFRKSNPPLLEWLQSPIVYRESMTAAERIRLLSTRAFSPKACLNHYLHMAKGNYRDYLQGERVRIKKYFYVLRPILACEWIEKYSTMPPIVFQRLVDTLVPEGSELRRAIESLLVRKMAGDEMDNEPRIGLLNDYLEERIAYYSGFTLQRNAAEGGHDRLLDPLFQAVLQEVWGNDQY